MRGFWVLAATASAAVMTAGAAQAATSVEIRDAAARVVVIPEARSDVKVEVIRTNASLPLTVEDKGDRILVDGGLRRISGCTKQSGRVRVRIGGVGDVAYDDLPQIVVRTPMKTKVAAGGAVFGSVGRTDALELGNAGCGDWTLGNVRGDLQISQAGSGDVRSGTAGDLTVRLSGSGDITTQAISNGATIDVAGSGNIRVASITGPLRASIAGSGDARFGGRATNAVVRIAGSGDVWLQQVDGLNVRIAGSGDVHVAQLTGNLSKEIVGSGDILIGR